MSDMIGVLGPKGTYTELAARRLYPDSELVYLDDVEEVFEYVKSGKGRGVVAIENSLEGSVGKTLACLMEYELKVCGEMALDINLCLIVNAGVDKEDIEVVTSHPHALAQCRRYLKEHFPKAKMHNSSSTASAVQGIKMLYNMAAIGNGDAAGEYGLEVLEENIQDFDSQTRFIAVSREECWGGKTSIIFAVKDEPGALYNILKIFADENINLTKIESRPSRRKLGEYVFYVDFENNDLDNAGVGKILEKVGKKTTLLKNLGSY
jgi:prephenate dehydratase